MYSLKLKTYVDKCDLRTISSVWDDPCVLLSKANSIKNLTVVKRQDERLYTHWEVNIEGALLSWYEEDLLDRKAGTISFSMQQGDFGDYRGCWRVSPVRGGRVKIELTASCDWGIPVLEAHVRKILERKTKVMFKSFLKAIKETLEQREEIED